MDIRFGEHPAFHKAAAGMVGGSVLAALALHPLTAHAPYVAGCVGIATGAGLAYGKLGLRLVAAAAAVTPLFVMVPSWPVLAGSALLLALGLAAGGPRGVRGVAGIALSTVTALVAIWCATRIVGARETQGWPGVATSLAGAAAMGMVGILAMLPRHLRLALDPVGAAIRALPVALDAEVKSLCDRAVAIWATTKDRLADTDAGRALVRDGVLKTLEVASKSADVKLQPGSGADLATRMTEMDARIAAATDDEVKQQYTAARAALDDQRRYRDQIAKGRERLVARMHNHVAALEKFQLAATGIEATRMASTSITVKQLAALSQEVAASGEALAEIELGVAGAPHMTAAS